MGYEVLDADGEAPRPHGDSTTRDAVEVLDLEGGPVAARTRPEVSRSGRGVVGAALVAVLALGALASQRGGPDPAAAPTPSPTPSTGPTSATTVVTAPGPDVGTGLRLSTSTDLRTTISVGHALVQGRAVSRQIAALQGALASRVVDASYYFEPDRYAAGASGPTGVRVVFNRRLADDAWSSARDALSEVDPTTSSLQTVTGTTVDISVPVARDAPCLVDAGSGEAAGVLDLSDTEIDQITALLPMFGLRAGGGRAVVTYVGPFRSRSALARVGVALATACEGPVSQVRLTRGPVYSS